jgi:hypothetical protein
VPEAHDLILRASFVMMPASASSGVRYSWISSMAALVGPAVQRPAQGPDGAGHRGIEIRQGRRDGARGEGGGVELVLGVQRQRYVEGLLVQRVGRLIVQHMQQVPGRGVVAARGFDAQEAGGEGVPVHQHGRHAGQQAAGNR